MVAFVTPAETLETYRDRLDTLAKTHTVEVFPADTVVIGIFFNSQELTEYAHPNGATMVISVQDTDAFQKEIPEYENGSRNYHPVQGVQALAKLDKFPA